MNRDEAKEKLKGRANGHFIVRKSSKKGKGTDAHRVCAPPPCAPVHPCRLSTPPPCHKHPPLLIWNPGTYCTGHFALSVVTNRRQSKGGLEHLLILPSFAGKDSNAPGNTRYRLGAYYKNKKETVNICRINSALMAAPVTPPAQWLWKEWISSGILEHTPRAREWGGSQISFLLCCHAIMLPCCCATKLPCCHATVLPCCGAAMLICTSQ